MPFSREQQEAIKQIIRQEFEEFLASDRYIFSRHVQMLDGRNVQTGRTTGTIIATDTDQKLGFWGKTPVDQPAAVADPTVNVVSGTGDDSTINTNFSNLRAAIIALRDRLKEAGIIA